MRDIIRLLPDHVANQIAAGEVIQRPASVVKELLENALDAQSTKIKVIIKEAGKSLIQVIDNGMGMSDTDARMSLERHATSKISQAGDLFAILTKGFRGEALASIISVAHMEMKTRREIDELGTRIVVLGSKIEVQEPVAALKGTDIAVKKLFFNIPARRKFLKSDAAEFRHILNEFNRIALAHSDTQFELYHNEKLILKLTSMPLVERIIGVLGKPYKEKLIFVEEDTEVVNIHGYVGTAESAKSRRGDQFLFINNRYFYSPYFNHAISAAYSNLVQDGKHPSYVLFLKVDPSCIDINVHPTKQEVKFQDERTIYDYLKVAVRHALAKHHLVPTMDFEPEPAIFRKPGFDQPPSKSNDTTHEIPLKNKGPQDGWENIYEDLKKRPVINQGDALVGSDMFDEKSMSLVPPSSSSFHGYLVRSTPDGLMIIDQRAAHIRVLFEDFLNRFRMEKAPTQGLIFPKTIELSPQLAQTMLSAIESLNRLGFEIAHFGQNSFVVHGLPAIHDFIKMDEDVIVEILEEIHANTGDAELLDEKLALASAKKAAISFDHRLPEAESKQLVEQLFSCDLPDRTPDGKSCFIIMPRSEIDGLFKKR